MRTRMNQKIYEVVVSFLQPETSIIITPELHLRQDLKLDSVGMMRLVALAETEFGIMFELTDKPPETVLDVVLYIEQKTNESA